MSASVKPWTVALQTPLSLGFSRWEYWSTLPFYSLGDLPDPETAPKTLMSPALAGWFSTTGATTNYNTVWVSESHSVMSNSLWSHGILQARILEWVAVPFSSRSSQPRDWTQVSCIAGRFFTSWATREAHSTICCRFSHDKLFVIPWTVAC